MSLNLNPKNEKKDDENSIISQRQDLMTSLTNDTIPTLRKAHFIKPLLLKTSKNQPFSRPTLALSSNPHILYELKEKIMLKCGKKTSEKWKTWVHNLEQTHKNIWNKVGIFNAIRASTYRVNIDNELIMNFAQKWCCETNTFVLPWGECSVTLEDVMVLGGFSVLGDSVLSAFRSRSCEDVAMEVTLSKCCVEIRRICYGHLMNSGWLGYFKGKGGELEHVGLIVLWLSKYVFSDSTEINVSIFPLAIRLARGTRIALAPAVLAAIYNDLRLLKGSIVDGDNGGNLVLFSPLQLVQVWAWERFPAMSPKPRSLVHGQPRIARWHNVPKLKDDSLRLNLDGLQEFFLWRPYGLYLENWEFPKFYSDEGKWVLLNSEVDEDFLSFAMCLRACGLEGIDCVEQYLPYRVGMQFGMDQDVPNFIPGENAEVYNPLEGVKFYIPHRLLEGDVTVRYFKWWRGESASSSEDMIVCRRQRTKRRLPKKAEILHKSVTPQFYSSELCNEAMGLDSVSCKENSKGKLSASESLASQSHVRTCECVAMDVYEQNNPTDIGMTSRLDMQSELSSLEETRLLEDENDEVNNHTDIEMTCGINMQSELNSVDDTGLEEDKENEANNHTLAERREYFDCSISLNEAANLAETLTEHDINYIPCRRLAKTDLSGGIQDGLTNSLCPSAPCIDAICSYRAAKHLDLASEARQVTVMGPMIRSEDGSIKSLVERDVEMEEKSGYLQVDYSVTECNGTLIGLVFEAEPHEALCQENSKYLEVSTSQIKPPTECNGKSIKMAFEDELREPLCDDTFKNRDKIPVNSQVIVSDDQDKFYNNPIERLCLEFESRISKLEKVVSALLAANVTSTSRSNIF